MPGDGDLGHLEGDVAAVAHDLRADLDELLPQARHRPIFDRLWRRQRAQEIAEVVGECVKLKSNSVGRERPTSQPPAFDRPLAFLDPLLACSALVVESNDALGRAAHVGDYKAETRIEITPESHRS